MLLNKATLAGAVFALLSLSTQAAELTTTNNTDFDSTVKVTSGRFHPCAGSIGEYTPAHGERVTPWGQVRGLCLSSGDNCTADIYMTKDCSGPVIGVASMDLSHQKITMLVSLDPRYNFHLEGSTHVVLDYATPETP